MLWIMQWLRDRITLTIDRLRRRQAQDKKQADLPPPNPIPPPPAPPEPEVVHVPKNRATRRALERRRRRHDKFVTPKGELPPRLPAPPRTPRVVKAKPIEVEIDSDDPRDAEMFIAGKHHEDTEEVLYKEAELHGEFHFRDTILQQLERYFVYLARMRKLDYSAYHLYRQYGATILPYVNVNAHDRGMRSDDRNRELLKDLDIKLSDWFHRTRPSFGCYAYGTDPESERYELEKSKEFTKKGLELWIPKFMYFTKYNRPPQELQRISGDGDVYAMTVWWDRPLAKKRKKQYGVPQEYGVWISRDGKNIKVLRSLVNDKWYIKHRPARERHEYVAVPRKQWRIPRDFVDWAKQDGDDPQHFLTQMFLDAVQHHALTQLNMVRVTARKGDMVAAFSVDIHKMSYFFQDRDIYTTDRGQRKRVFHMVRPHVRADGTEVKTHFRGQREFTWADYQILITIPGRDHLIFDDIDVGIIDEREAEKGRKYMDNKELGERLAKNIRQRTHGIR